jgi:hypothetical protein
LDDGYAHICSTKIDRPAKDALSFLSDPLKLSSWAVGMGETIVHDGILIEGFNANINEPIWAKIEVDLKSKTLQYYIGPKAASLVPRIMIRIVAPDVLQEDEACCVVSMITWRQSSMDNARWESLKALHESEIKTVKQLIEAGVA